MNPAEKYGELAEDSSIKMVIEKLMGSGIRVFLVNNKAEARIKVLEFIPHKSEVMTMTSTTLSEIGVDMLLNESNDYISVRSELMNPSIEKIQKQRL